MSVEKFYSTFQVESTTRDKVFALDEAKELAKKQALEYPGSTFIVMEATSFAYRLAPPMTESVIVNEHIFEERR